MEHRGTGHWWMLGTIIACLSAQLLHSATSNTDNGFVGRFNSNVQKLKTFTIRTVQDVPREANDTVTSSLLEVENDIKGFVDRVAGTVMGKINATSLLDQAEVLGNASRAAFDDLQNVNNSLDVLLKLQHKITGELDSIKNDTAHICANINVSPGCDTSGLELKVNFSGLDHIKHQMNSVSNAQDISQAVAVARKQFVNVNQNALDKFRTDLNGTLGQVNSIRTQVQAKLQNISNITGPVTDFLDSSMQHIDWSKDLINKIGTYIWYGTTSLSCLLMLSVLLYYIGILIGLCGKRAGDDAPSCNKGTGALCISCGNSWAMVFYGLLMLVVILLFTIGGPVYAMGCRFLNGGVEGVKTFDSLFTDLIPWRWGSSLQNISSALENCKENKGLYTALHLIDTTINLEDWINMTTDLNNVTGTDLGTLATSLNKTAEEMEKAGNASNAALLRNQSYKLVLLRDNDIAKFTEAKESLGRLIKSLQEKSNLSTQAAAWIEDMKQAQKYLKDNVELLMKQALNETANTVTSNISRIFDDILHKLKNDIGKCRSAYDAIQGISDSVCITVLNPFNGFWFGLGCALFFFIPSTIFGDILKWFLRRKHPYKKKETDDYPGSVDYSGHVQDNIPLRHQPSEYVYRYPQGAVSTVYHNPGFEPDINRQFSPDGRPLQHERYVDYREMASNYAVIPDHTPGPGRLY
ncbi:hypothetical protein ACJMK2_034683 [Sinanodonta woodiana]|uniref:Prominin-1-A-like n=1 Tax=Sinanodonta woodiana TaxID=1069815 RepID=A0ABD3WSE1_SINWO